MEVREKDDDNGMRGRQSEKTTVKVRERREETDRGVGSKRKQVINNLPGGHLYLEVSGVQQKKKKCCEECCREL